MLEARISKIISRREKKNRGIYIGMTTHNFLGEAFISHMLTSHFNVVLYILIIEMSKFTSYLKNTKKFRLQYIFSIFPEKIFPDSKKINT